MYRILLIEDDEDIAGAIARKGEKWNLQIHPVRDFDAVLEEFEALDPHLVMIDISLPRFDGFFWCQRIRERSKAPILFLSSAAEKMNLIMAMNLGADDFIAKPFDLDVLMAKLQALLRRSYDFSRQEQLLILEEASLDLVEQCLIVRDQRLALSKNEFRILQVLMEHPYEIVSRERLMDRLWKTQVFVDDNTLTVNVNRLRKKLETARLGSWIETKVGQGYRLAKLNP